jgi:pentalenene oxygenase
VLVDDRTFDKGGPFIDAFREVVGNGLGTSPHRLHRRPRRLLQPAFHRGRSVQRPWRFLSIVA